MIRHPSITTNDFDITPEGSLVVKISPPAERYKAPFDTTLPLNLDKLSGKGSRVGATSPNANKVHPFCKIAFTTLLSPYAESSSFEVNV